MLEVETRAFLDELAAAGGPPFHAQSPDAARRVLAAIQSRRVGRPAARIEELAFPVGPTGSVKVRMIRPRNGNEPLPAIMYFHGGGWVLGDSGTHDRLVREIARGAHAAVVFVHYSLSPESRFPVPVEEAYAATKYVAEYGALLQLDGSRLAVAGDGAGGNMAAAVALLCKERRGPTMLCQVLFCPVTDANFETASYLEFKDGPWLTRPAMQWFWNAYLPDQTARRQSIATPLNADRQQLCGLPETLIITAENDVLRDEGEAYAAKLDNAGVRVTSTRYNGTIHDFVMLNALSDTPAARAAIQQATDALHIALHGQ